MTSSHQVLVPAVFIQPHNRVSWHKWDLMCFKGSEAFFALQLHTEQLLQMITSLMVRNAVIQTNLQLILCVDIF